MNLDDRLRHAGERLNTKLAEVTVPSIPQPGWPWWRPVVATAFLVLVVGGSLLWISRGEGPGHGVIGDTPHTLSTQTDDDPGQVGPTLVVGSGTVAGSDEAWQLSVFASDEDHLCMSLGSLVCSSVPDELQPLTVHSIDSYPTDIGLEPSCAVGALAREVAGVTLTFSDGSSVDTPILDGKELPANFYAHCWGGEIRLVRVSVVGAAGVEIDFMEMSDTDSPLAALPACESLVWPSAPDNRYRDEPVYSDDDQEFFDEVGRFAATLAGFESIWADRSRNLWATVGFVNADVAERQAQLAEAFPGAGVVAVKMAYTSAELEALSNQIEAELPAGMTAHSIYEIEGYVGVWVGVITRERVAELATMAGDRPVCWDGYEPDEVVGAGPQLSGGDGWQYLGEYARSIGREPRIIATDVALGELWNELDATEPVPQVDFVTDIVVTFEVGSSANCSETRFDSIEVTEDLVHAVVVDPSIGTGPPRSCFPIYVARTYVVALSRNLLPAPPFTIKTGPNYAAEAAVVADLRQPGSDIEP